MWYHRSQLSQHTAFCFQLQDVLHDPQGYLGGPGFGSGAYEFVRRMLHRYVNTSLSYLIVLVFLDSTIMDVVEMLDLYVSWFAIVTDQDLSGASLFSLMILFEPTVLQLTIKSNWTQFDKNSVRMVVVSTVFIVFMVYETVVIEWKIIGS
jgi:hypothetical protein